MSGRLSRVARSRARAHTTHSRSSPLSWSSSSRCGSLLLVALAAAQGSPLAPFTVVAFAFLTISAVVKGLYYHRFKVPQAQWRYVFLALAFVVPIVAIGLELGSSWLPAVAAVVAIAGVLVERWLFFVEARGGVEAPPGEPAA